MLINILICTAAMWVLDAVLVTPVSTSLAIKSLSKLNLPVFAAGNVEFENLPEDEQQKVSEVTTFYYILVDVITLGVAGFLLGFLFGLFFIGISFEQKSWPGMAAFIILSLIGSSIY